MDARGVARTRVVAGLIFILLGSGFLAEDYGWWQVELVYLWPLVLIGFGTSVLIGRAERIRVEEDRSAQLAVAEERVRIARELHDIVAHSVSLMTIQIAAARRVFASKPDAARHALEQAERTGRESLTELRSLVNLLRSADASLEAARPGDGASGDDDAADRAPLPGLGDLEALVVSIREAGTLVLFDEVGDRPLLKPSVQLVVYRVVQEALTNVLRHAGSAQVRVTVLYAPDAVEVWVDDDGAGAGGGPRGDGSGHGLLGMRERVETLGGKLSAGPHPSGSGWQVHAWIPIDDGGAA